MSFFRPKLLVYIPTYVDHYLAANQARILRAEFNSVKMDIRVVISVNGVKLTAKDIENLENSCHKLIIFKENLGGDTNINLGFLCALEENADFLWILSANDTLLIGAGCAIQSAIENMDSDFLLIGKSNGGPSGILTNAFSDESANLPLGLISAVIYRSAAFKEAFASSLKFAWTGWGQLSVIQNALFGGKELKYEMVNEQIIYDRAPKTSIAQQLETNQSNYRHSFFGYPLLIALLFEGDKKLANRLIRKWLWANWYKIGFFKNGNSPYQLGRHSAHDAFWTGPLSKPYILKSGMTGSILYLLGHIPFITLTQKFPFLTKSLSSIFKERKSSSP